MKSPPKPKPNRAPEPQSEQRVIPLHLARCPYCHDDVGDASQAVCAGCLARHHRACWDESPRCAACGSDEALAPAWQASPRLRRLVVVLVALAVFSGVRAVVARLGARPPQLAPGQALEVAQTRLVAELGRADAALAEGDWPAAYEAAHTAAVAYRAEAHAKAALYPSQRADQQRRVADELAATFRFDRTFSDLVAEGNLADQEIWAREALRIVREALPR